VSRILQFRPQTVTLQARRGSGKLHVLPARKPVAVPVKRAA
jgi:hypothetical protein